MTPLLFTSFLVSLLLVDLRNSALRAHYHATDQTGRMLPRWLHRLVYRYRPYRYDVAAGAGAGGSPSSPESPGSVGEREDYYHSKQRKLMRMEAEEAFEIRGGVVVALVVVGLGVLWVLWRGLGWGLRAAREWGLLGGWGFL